MTFISFDQYNSLHSTIISMKSELKIDLSQFCLFHLFLFTQFISRAVKIGIL